MKSSMILAFVLLLGSSMNTFAADSSKNKKNTSASSLGTSFRLSPMALNGKYQNSRGTEAIVENDKYLDDLLAPRKSFADRMKQNQQRN